MANTNDLNFTVILYNGDAKVHTLTLNYFLPNAYEVIEDYFLRELEETYTSIVITHAGQEVLRKSLVGSNYISPIGQ